MSEFNYDFTGVKAREGFERPRYPEGWYMATIQKVVDGASGAGHRMPKVTYLIIEGDYEGKKISENICFHPNLKNRNKHYLKVINQDCENQVRIKLPAWEGQSLKIKLKDKEYPKGSGEIQSEIVQHQRIETDDFFAKPPKKDTKEEVVDEMAEEQLKKDKEPK